MTENKDSIDNKQTDNQDEKLEPQNLADDTGEEIEVEVKSTKNKSDENSEAAEQPDNIENLLSEKTEQYLRLAAEFDNYKKRTAREFVALVETANQGLIVSLLDILDNFNRALDEDNTKSENKSFLKGVKLIYAQLENLLKEKGLEEIEALGNEFDPNLHEAVMTWETDEYPEDYVAEEMQKGYKLKGRVIRHTKVAVSKPKDEN